MINIKFKRNYIFAFILYVISTAIIIYCLFIYLHMGSYVMPAADDFTISSDIKEHLSHGESYLKLGCKLMCETYLTWQGTFSSNFLLYYAAPYTRMGVEGIRLFCCISILAFYGSLWFIIHCIMKYLFRVEKSSIILCVYALIIWMISNARMMMETFFWYNGICVYTLPLICTLLGIQCLVKYTFVKEKSRYFIGAIILGIVACGGVLQCSAIVCFGYLLICLWGFCTKHVNRQRIGIIFLAVLLGALINTLAPGNFVRHGAIDESGLPVFSSFGYSLQNVILELRRLLYETDMPYFLIVILLVGFCTYQKDRQKMRIHGFVILLSVLGILLCTWISCYPVALGYSGIYMEPRGYAIIDVFLVVGFMLCMFMTGMLLHQCFGKYMLKETAKYGAVISLVLIICVVLNIIVPLKNIDRPLYICVEDEKYGYLERFSNMWGSIFEQIENSQEKNVVIQSQPIPDPAILKNPDLSTDADYWINKGVARYFGKETIAIEWVE